MRFLLSTLLFTTIASSNLRAEPTPEAAPISGELAAARVQWMKAVQKEAFRTTGQVVLGNPKAAHTAAVFLDYRCGYCRRMVDALNDALKKHPNLKIVVQQTAVLGEESHHAAAVALAAADAGKGAAAHTVLMHYSGDWTTPALAAAVGKAVGLSADALERAATSDAVKTRLQQALTLSNALGVNGTPTFLSQADLLPGALPPDVLEKFLQRAQEGAPQ